MIAALKLEIEKLRRALYGTKSERKARLLEQLELQLEELEAAATEDELAAERQATPVAAPSPATERRRPARKPFPAHLPRERVVVAAPETCTCCGSGRIVKLGEDGEPFVCHWSEDNGERDAGGDPAAVEGDPDGAREVHLPGLRAHQPAAGAVPSHPARLGRTQPAGDNPLRERGIVAPLVQAQWRAASISR